MTKEALKLAQKALSNRNAPAKTIYEALAAIQKALANEALEKKAENARELGLDYEPAGHGGRPMTLRECMEAEEPEQKPMHPQLKAMLEDYFDKCFAESKPKCNTHPKAPHGFNRNASHSADRYVCECEAWDPYEAGRQDGIEAMLKYDNPAPYVFLTATEIVDCATATYQCDPNDVTENDIKFARHIERLTLER